MPLANVAYAQQLTWADPSLVTLEQQALVPLLGSQPIEMGFQLREQEILSALRQDQSYAAAFAGAFPSELEPISVSTIVKAIAAFERTLLSGNSPYDRYVRGDEGALSESARRGMELFFSERLACSQCHAGMNFSGPMIPPSSRTAESDFTGYANNGLYDVDGRGSYKPSNIGLKEITGRDEHMGKFKIPSLRNVALTAPYMHDGTFGTLEGVIDHYNRGGLRFPTFNPVRSQWTDPRIRPLDLRYLEKADLIEFLKSLTDDDFGKEFADVAGPAPKSAY